MRGREVFEEVGVEQFLPRAGAIPEGNPARGFLNFEQVREVGAQRSHARAAADVDHFLTGRLDVKITERPDNIDRVAGFEGPHVARAGAGGAFLPGGRRGDANIQTDRAFARVAGDRVVVALRAIGVFGNEVENAVPTPYFRVGLRDIEAAVGDLAVGGDGELQVVAGLVGKRAVHRLQDDFANEGRDIGGTHNPERAAFLLARTGAARFGDIQVNPAVADLDRVGGEAPADRGAGWRAVGEVESAVVFRAFDDAAFYEAFGEVVVAVRANAVGGVKAARRIADEGEGFPAMVEAEHILLAEISLGANLHPAFGVGLGIARDKALDSTLLWSGKDPFDMVAWVFSLPNDGRQNLAPGRED